MICEVKHVRHGLLHLQLLDSVTDGFVSHTDPFGSELELGTKVVLDMDIFVKTNSRKVFSAVNILISCPQRFAILEKCDFRTFQLLQIFQVFL